jgi:hypothetical protein
MRSASRTSRWSSAIRIVTARAIYLRPLLTQRGPNVGRFPHRKGGAVTRVAVTLLTLALLSDPASAPEDTANWRDRLLDGARRMRDTVRSVAKDLVTAEDSLWAKLGEDDRRAILDEVKAWAEAELEESDSEIVPNDAGKDHAAARFVITELVKTRWSDLATHAGELAAGDTKGAVPLAGVVFERAADHFKDYLAEQLPQGTLARVGFDVLAKHPESLRTLGQAAFDPRVTWSELGDRTWREVRLRAGEDLQEQLQSLAARGINFAISERAVLGVNVSDVFFWLLAAEQEFARFAQLKVAVEAGDRIYAAYREERRAGRDPQAAFEAVGHLLVGGVGNPGGGFFSIHFSTPEIATLFEECHGRRGASCFLILQDAVRARLQPGRERLGGAVTTGLETTRGDVDRALGAIGQRLREAIRAKVASDKEVLKALQAALAAARAEIDRLRAAGDLVSNLCADYTRSEIDATEAFDALVGLEAASAALDGDLALLERCGGAASRPGADAASSALERATTLAAALRGQIADADAASTEACDFGAPRSAEEAAEIIKRSAAAGARAGRAIARARAHLRELEAVPAAASAAAAEAGRRAAAEASSWAPARAAADRLAAALPKFEGAAALEASYAAARGAMGDLADAVKKAQDEAWRLRDAAIAALVGVRDHPEAQALIAEATALEGRASDCLAVEALAGFDRSRQGALARALTATIAERVADARAGITVCRAAWDAAPVPAVESGGLAEIVADARLDAARLDAFETAVQLCVASAAQQLDRLRREPREASELEPETETETEPESGSVDRPADGRSRQAAGAETAARTAEEPRPFHVVFASCLPDLPRQLPEGVKYSDRLRDMTVRSTQWVCKPEGRMFFAVSGEGLDAYRAERFPRGARFSLPVTLALRDPRTAQPLSLAGALLLEALDVAAAAPPTQEDGKPTTVFHARSADGSSQASAVHEGAPPVQLQARALVEGWPDRMKQENLDLIRSIASTFDCFVATSVYRGAGAAPALDRLRRFRDQVLVRSPEGRRLVDWYWRRGPQLAALVRHHPEALPLLRGALDRLAVLLDPERPTDPRLRAIGRTALDGLAAAAARDARDATSPVDLGALLELAF